MPMNWPTFEVFIDFMLNFVEKYAVIMMHFKKCIVFVDNKQFSIKC